jgi:GH18 family chitinase
MMQTTKVKGLFSSYTITCDVYNNGKHLTKQSCRLNENALKHQRAIVGRCLRASQKNFFQMHLLFHKMNFKTFLALNNFFLLLIISDEWQDLEDNYGKGGFKRLTAYKNTHKHLKVLLAIGGWNEGSRNYSDLAGDPHRRGRFVKQASEYVRQHNFDGLDLDWE